MDVKRYWVRFFITALVLVIISFPRVFLVPRLVQGLEEGISQSLNSNDVNVSLRAPLGWELIFGRLPKLEIVARNAVMDGLSVYQVRVQGDQIRFDPRSLWQDQELFYTESSNLRGEILVTEDALNELFWEEVDPDRFLKLEVSPSGIGVLGQISFLNMNWSITLLGEVQVLHGTAIGFKLKDIAVQETKIPAFLLEVLSENYEFVIDFGVFPYPVELTEVRLLEKQIQVHFGGI